MHYSEKVKGLFEHGLRTCEFVVTDRETKKETICGKQTVAVYVSADGNKEFRPICLTHRDAAWAGDGPVYDLVPVVRTKSIEELVEGEK
jgi:hypothetical protein